jgi:hypothetical protein
MHHQVQQFGNLGLEWLGHGGCIGIGGHYRSRLRAGAENLEKPDIAMPFGVASF